MEEGTNFTAKICEECYEDKKTEIDEIFPTKAKVRSWHDCYFCKDKTHWEFAVKVSSKKELKDFELKLVYLKKDYI